MLHVDKEVFAYAISFLILFSAAYIYLRKSLLDSLDEKVTNFQNFFSSAKYLQNVSMRLIMQEKQKKEELNDVLNQIKHKAEKDVQKFEQNSRNAINEQSRKWKEENTQRMRKINIQFANDIKEETVNKLLSQLTETLQDDKVFSNEIGLSDFEEVNQELKKVGRR